LVKGKIPFFILLAGFLTGLMLLSSCVPDSTGEGGGFNVTSVIMVVALIALFYFLIFRPMRKRQKDQQKLLSELRPGDKVIAAGGIYGEVESISEDSVVLKVESGARIRVTKQGIMIKRQLG